MKLSLGDIIGILSLLVAVIALIISIKLKWIIIPFKRLAHIYNSTQIVDFDKTEVKKSKRYFIPNHIIYNNEVIESNSIQFIIKNILFKEGQEGVEERIFLIIGRTGIGKTTFLCNLFLALKKYTRWKSTPTVLLGKMRSGETWRRIEEFVHKGNDKNTILLIDALDEFSIDKTTVKINDYLKAFEKNWEEKKYLLPGFKKVIISVREQFIHSKNAFSKSDLGISLLDENIKDNPLHQIHLSQFTSEQAIDYIKKRYDEDPALQTGLIDFLGFIQHKMDEQKLNDLFSTPLFLSFLEEIKKGYMYRSKLVFSNFIIYDLIVKQWLEREYQAKKMKDSNISTRAIANICEKIAYKLYETGFDELSDTELIEIENSVKGGFDFRKGLTERSLLKKNSIETYSESGFKTRQESYRFIHKSFFDYFLASYELNRKNDIEVNFGVQINAADFYINMLWSKREYKEMTDKIKNIEISEWVNFLESFSENTSIRNALLNNTDNILDREDQYWKKSVSGKTFIVNSNNFWDYELKQPYPYVVKAIQFLRTQIQTIVLSEIPITDEQLDCIDGVELSDLLYLINCPNLTNKCLRCFRKTTKLMTLEIDNMNFDDSALFYLAELNDLRSIYIKNTKITGSGLKHLQRTSKTILGIIFDGNRLLDEQLNTLTLFKPRRMYILNESYLTGEFFRFLNNPPDVILEFSNLKIDWTKYKLPIIWPGTFIKLENMGLTDNNISQVLYEPNKYASLDVSNNIMLTEVTFFKNCKYLKYLKISGCGFSDIAIEQLKNQISEVDIE